MLKSIVFTINSTIKDNENVLTEITRFSRLHAGFDAEAATVAVASGNVVVN